MPFLNDMLDESNRRRLEAERLAAENMGPVTGVQSAEDQVIQSRYRFDVDAVMAVVRKEIIGQDEAVGALERILRIVRADIADPRRPLHTALFLGPTGVGKTELVRALARGLHGDADAFCRVDMNTLSQEHYAAAITGAPPGYVGSKEGTTILNQALIEGSLGKPGIVLFDELEKASDEVVQALLNVFDNGMLTVASGERTYSFRNTLVFMTSNLGARRLQRYEERRERFPFRYMPVSRQQRRVRLSAMMEKELLRRFVPEFVNRIDTISVFNWIHGALVEQLVDLETERLNRRLRKHHIVLRLDPAVRRSVAREGFDRKFGARSLRRAMRHKVEAPLAEYLLTDYANANGARCLEARMDARRVVKFVPVDGA